MCQMCSGNRFAVPAPKPRIQPSLLSVGPGSRPPTHLRFGVFIRKEGKRVCPENFGRNKWQALPAYCSNAKSRRTHPISAPIPPPSPRRNSHRLKFKVSQRPEISSSCSETCPQLKGRVCEGIGAPRSTGQKCVCVISSGQ